MKSPTQSECKESKFHRSSKLVKFIFYLFIVFIFFIFAYAANASSMVNLLSLNFTPSLIGFLSIFLISLIFHLMISHSDPGFVPTNNALMSIEIHNFKSIDNNIDLESLSEDGLIKDIPKFNKTDSEISNTSESSMLIGHCKRDGCKMSEMLKGSCGEEDDISPFCSVCNIDRV